ncbi:hypothetical protein QJQ45_026386 [Haematococcus lacustris]|nr:hypothetical protein QJQ45_026386 [Haematococcus lacustris]
MACPSPQWQGSLPLAARMWHLLLPGMWAGWWRQVHLSKWEQRMATMRALNRRHMTVPQEFGTHTARTPAEALQRRQRILLEMQADEELLPESRWPFKSLRGRVQPQPPPVFTQPDHKVSDTRANMLRRAKTHQARRQGQFDDPEDKERKALLRARTEAEERAKVYMALKTKQAYGKPSSSSMPAVNHGNGQDPGVADENAQSENEPRRSKAEQRELIKANTAVPVQHVEARHAQVEAKVRSMVEGALLQTGLSAYNAYTYQETP